MANLKEIRAKVISIQSTQKITRAMQMVAASKMRRAQERMEVGRPYADSMRRVISHLVHASSDYKHPYMVSRPVNRVGYIVITSDRGLAGGLNINLFKALTKNIQQYQNQSVQAEFAVIGSKGVSFFKNFGGKVTAAVTDYGDKPTFEQINSFMQLPESELESMLEDLTQKGYLKFEHPKKLVKEQNGNGTNTFRVSDETKPKGYNIVTGKLSFEINKILFYLLI